MAVDADSLVVKGQRVMDDGDLASALASFEAALEREESADLRQLAGGLRYLDDDLEAAGSTGRSRSGSTSRRVTGAVNRGITARDPLTVSVSSSRRDPLERDPVICLNDSEDVGV